MTATAGSMPLRRGARLRTGFFGLPGWIVLALAVTVTLVIGSIHPPASSAAARISRLDSIIKCPSCDNLSIGESDAATAVTLRALVARNVHAGESDAQIESYVQSRYGAAVLLSPTDPVVWIVPIVALAAGGAALAAFLFTRRRRASPPAVAADEELVAAALAGFVSGNGRPGD